MTTFLNNFSASAISIFICQPVDVLKTNYQVNKFTIKNNVMNIYDKYGIRGFYRGLNANISSIPIFWSIFFQVRKHMNNYGFKNDAFLTSYLSGNISSLITNPLFVIKTRLQTSGEKSIFKVSKNIYKLNGKEVFLKGAPASMFNNLKLGVQFPLYQLFKDNNYSIFLSSLLAKGISSSLLYPLDLVRVQQRNSDIKKSIIDILKEIYKKYKFLGFYRGVLLYNMISIPNFVIMMNIIELIKKDS